MMKHSIILFILIFSMSCSYKEESFSRYLLTLDKLKLPLSYNTHTQIEPSVGYDSTLFNQYKCSWTYKPSGILYETKNSVGVIEYSVGDIGTTPVLVTYNLKGIKIDSLFILKNVGFWETGQNLESAVLTSNNTIVITDTIKTWKLDQNYEIIESTVEVDISRSTYQIKENGLIQKSENQSGKI
ncbi:hypothetical protein [Flammeovirga agarivorans]|uniref:Uncharacterized protein n=1 Tax=Flammeovirga agarivorans TaxID=2726742 RepID=A0A7X8XZB9_9BACT|nr:hypothetical protein [Flammeovirga agarivorans]NLR95041.1 hypothetical protein [Flammeovirga agarivorans]